MVEQDYIMRLIKEMVRAILKLLFHVDTALPSAELLEKSEQKEALDKLLAMVDEGKLNEAENRICDIMDADDGGLKVALLFYSYLNDRSDEFLEANHYSRDEIKQGLESIVSRYGLEGMAEVFLQ